VQTTDRAHVYLGDPKKSRGERPRGDDSGRSTSSARPLSILIVDDVEDTRFLYQRYFEWHGARVTTVADGAAALDAVLSSRPDIVVLDLAMPRITGWEVLHHLKSDARTHNIPVVVVSGQDARTSATLAGADSYFEKPCLPDALLAGVRRVIARSNRKPD
jgi:CheY-like chemotaxis protein